MGQDLLAEEAHIMHLTVESAPAAATSSMRLTQSLGVPASA
jgi:hypothetical protein